MKKFLDFYRRVRFAVRLRLAEFYYRQLSLYDQMDSFISQKESPHSAALVMLASQVRYNKLEYEKKLDDILTKMESN